MVIFMNVPAFCPLNGTPLNSFEENKRTCQKKSKLSNKIDSCTNQLSEKDSQEWEKRCEKRCKYRCKSRMQTVESKKWFWLVILLCYAHILRVRVCECFLNKANRLLPSTQHAYMSRLLTSSCSVLFIWQYIITTKSYSFFPLLWASLLS